MSQIVWVADWIADWAYPRQPDWHHRPIMWRPWCFSYEGATGEVKVRREPRVRRVSDYITWHSADSDGVEGGVIGYHPEDESAWLGRVVRRYGDQPPSVCAEDRIGPVLSLTLWTWARDGHPDHPADRRYMTCDHREVDDIPL